MDLRSMKLVNLGRRRAAPLAALALQRWAAQAPHRSVEASRREHRLRGGSAVKAFFKEVGRPVGAPSTYSTK